MQVFFFKKRSFAAVKDLFNLRNIKIGYWDLFIGDNLSNSWQVCHLMCVDKWKKKHTHKKNRNKFIFLFKYQMLWTLITVSNLGSLHKLFPYAKACTILLRSIHRLRSISILTCGWKENQQKMCWTTLSVQVVFLMSFGLITSNLTSCVVLTFLLIPRYIFCNLNTSYSFKYYLQTNKQ